MLERLNKDLGKVIQIDVMDDTLKKRIVGRASCKNCGAVYNDMIENLMPKVKNTCDKCGNTLSKREDDNLETFDARLKTYYEQTKPLIEYYKSLNLLTKVDGNLSSNEIFNNICNILEGE